MSGEAQRTQEDEQAIRDLIQQWLAASKRHDVDAVLPLAAPDVLFHVPGAEPFGLHAFAAGMRANAGITIEGTCDTLDVAIAGDLGYARNLLRLRFTHADCVTSDHTVYTLGVYRRNAAGKWQLWRDANVPAAAA